MVTKVTSYKAHDGTLFDDEQAAVLHETKLEKEKYKRSILNNIISSSDMVDRKHCLTNIERLFTTKSGRQMIREALDLHAEIGND